MRYPYIFNYFIIPFRNLLHINSSIIIGRFVEFCWPDVYIITRNN